MPVVPVAQRQVRVRPLDDTPYRAADFSAGWQAAAKGVQNLGDGVADFAETQDRIDATMDEAAAKQLDVEFATFERETLWNAETGFYAQSGQNALNARKGTEDALTAKRAELLAKATNPRARQMLTEVLDRRMEQSLTSIGRYAQGQAEVYERGVSLARIETTVEEAIAFRDQPDRFQSALETIDAEVIDRGQREGWSPEMVMLERRKARTGVHVKVAEAIAVGDPAAAARYVEINGTEIEPTARLALEKMLADPLLEQEADEQAAAIRGLGAPVVAGPVQFDALATAVEGRESRGRNGLRSPKGALGVMQVMPATARDLCEKLGIPYDEAKLRNDPEYCRRLGREYLAQQMAKYGGNATLALAAYNAGPGAVDGWLKSIGDPRKGEISDAEFAARIPYAETRAYVPGVMKRLGAGGPQNAPRENDLATQLAKADAITDPKLREKVRSKLMTADAVDQRLLKDQQQKAADEAWTIAMQPGFTSVRSIPPALWSRLDVSVQRSLSQAAEQNLKGADAPPNPQLYVELSDMASKNPNAFADLNLAQYAHQLPKGDWEQFVTLQRSVRNGGTKAPEFVTAERIRSTTNDLALAVGLDTSRLKGDKKAAMASNVAQFRQRVADDAAAFVAREGRQPTDDEIRKMADRWLIKVSVVGGDEDVFQFETRPGDKVTIDYDDIPERDRQELAAEFERSQGRRPNSDADFALIRRKYLEVKNRR